ncbi:Sap, sulfolipid-1-addressing protein [Curtobacterium sp. UNCCL20]|nr:Sap, sulfolipid-1-addressing protein [Curtobacterium sp. UNCCL20]
MGVTRDGLEARGGAATGLQAVAPHVVGRLAASGCGPRGSARELAREYDPAVDVLALVPGAVGIALSPLPIASVVFLLGHRRGSASALACALGWIAAVAVALVASVLVGESLPSQAVAGSRVQAVIALCAAVLLAGLAVWQWLRRRLPDGSPASSRWADAMEAIGPGRAFGLGALLFLSPKSLVLALAAGLAFGDADPSAPETVLVAVLFVAVSGAAVLLPVVLAVTMRSGAQRVLAAVRDWIARWGSISLVVLLVVLAVVQLVIGLVGLR